MVHNTPVYGKKGQEFRNNEQMNRVGEGGKNHSTWRF